MAPRLRRPAIADVARRGARPDGARRRDALGCGDRGVGDALRPGDRRRGPRLHRASARAGGRARRHGIGRDAGRPVGQHAPRHADHRGDVLRARVRRFPEPAAARAGDWPQHGGVRRADAGPRPGAPAEAPPTRSDQGVDVAVARVLDHETPIAGARRLRCRDGCARRGLARASRGHVARAHAIDHAGRPVRGVGSADVRVAERCLRVARTRTGAGAAAPGERGDGGARAGRGAGAHDRRGVGLAAIGLGAAPLGGARPRSGVAAAGDSGRPGPRRVSRGIPGGHAGSISPASSETSRSGAAPHLRRLSGARPGRRDRPVRLARGGWLDARDVRISRRTPEKCVRSNGSRRRAATRGD